MEELKKAIAIYQKLRKESTKAHTATREAAEAASEAWSRYRVTKESLFTETPEGIAANQASERENAARKAEKIATLAARAASLNVVYAANNVLCDAVKANPDKFKNPTHYEKTKKAIAAVFEESGEKFYITSSFYTKYLHFSGGEYGADEVYFCTTDTEGAPIDAEKVKHKIVLDEKTIKAEARQAAKDAAKIEAIQKEAAAKVDAIRNKYQSQEVKNKLPYLSAYIGSAGSNPGYRLFLSGGWFDKGKTNGI